jgi:hypothetical protein
MKTLIVDIDYIRKRYYDFLYMYYKNSGLLLYTYLVDQGFFEAPASAGHHLSIDGGLAIHSFSVMEYAVMQAQQYNLPISINSIIICALLHDVCKMFYYKKINGEWVYADNNRERHGQHSIDIIESFIELTKQEREMILWHMGVYSEYFDGHKSGDFLKWSADKQNKDINAALFLYMCDHFSSMFLEG